MIHALRWTCCLCLVSFGALTIAGCSDGLGNRRAVKGTIKLKGQPLDQGIIEFTPQGSSTTGDPTTKSGTSIANGSYSIPREQGLVPAKYLVTIRSGDGVNIENPSQPPGPTGNYVSRERIPKEFNDESKQDVEVKLDGDNTFNFDIP